jgi:hypothetical protein
MIQQLSASTAKQVGIFASSQNALDSVAPRSLQHRKMPMDDVELPQPDCAQHVYNIDVALGLWEILRSHDVPEAAPNIAMPLIVSIISTSTPSSADSWRLTRYTLPLRRSILARHFSQSLHVVGFCNHVV